MSKGRITTRTRLIELCLFGCLHSSSVYRTAGIVVCLMEVEGCDMDRGDSMSNIPFGLVACYGNEEAVEMLLRQEDTKVNEPNEGGQTPLWLAARNGDEEVVKILLRRGDADPKKIR